MYGIPKINRLFLEMMACYMGDAKRIQHFTKVHSYAKLIGECEGLEQADMFLLETVSLVHDIGIKVCEEKYGSCTGKQQEQEGPALAKALLTRLNYEKDQIEEVCYIIAHHHTYQNISSKIYQILVEADFLVNLYEDQVPESGCKHALDTVFRTATGKTICQTMFHI